MEGIFDPVEVSEANIKSLFGSEEEVEDTTTVETKEEEKEDKSEQPLDGKDLFKSNQESVEEETDNEDTTSSDTSEDTDEQEDSDSPNIFSSFAKSLESSGVLTSLDDETFNSIVDEESLVKAMEKQIEARLDERQKRIEAALNSGVDSDVIKRYESVIKNLDSITEDQLTAETEEAENYRKNLIYNDYVSKGFSQEKAVKLTEASINDGSDIDDAREALDSLKKRYIDEYNTILETKKREAENATKERQERAENLKKTIINGKEENFLGLQLDTKTKEAIYDNLSNASFYDKELDIHLTKIQKYEKENPDDFLKYISMFFTLTDGFKNVDKIFRNTNNKEMKKRTSNLEKVLTKNSTLTEGGIKFMNGTSVKEDPNSEFKNYKVIL